MDRYQLAKACKVSYQAVQQWEKGKTTPSATSLLDIAAATCTDPHWLIHGREPNKSQKIISALVEAGATARSSLPYEASTNSNVEPGPDIFGKVPLISHIQAGNWCDAVDNFHPGDAEEWLPAPTRHGPHAYALRVVGSSMEPRFREGEIVVVDPEVTATSGRFVVAKKVGTQEVTLKQLVIEAGDSYLKAMNPHWPEPIIRLTEDWLVCGSVICKVEIF